LVQPTAGDSGCYEQTLAIDANGHQSGTLVDGLGRTAYEQRYTGNSTATYAVYATAKYSYDYAGELVKIVQRDHDEHVRLRHGGPQDVDERSRPGRPDLLVRRRCELCESPR
jgi:hypothetical protein